MYCILESTTVEYYLEHIYLQNNGEILDPDSVLFMELFFTGEYWVTVLVMSVHCGYF